MKEPKISSITYVKNGVNYIEQCVRSVMNQSLTDIEIIIVDGGSTDGTWDILTTLANEDDRIILLINTDGVGAQFNEGLRHATGEYIAICEGDDFIYSDKYRKQYDIAHNNGVDVLRACYDLYFTYQENEYRYKVQVAADENYDRLILANEYGNRFLEQFVNGYWNGIYSRDFLISHNIFQNETQGASFQDITFSFLSQLYANRIWFMSESLHCYRIDNPSASVNSNRSWILLFNEYHLLGEQLKQRGLCPQYLSYYFLWEMYSCKQFMDRCPLNEKDNYITNVYSTLQDQGIAADYNNINIYHKTKDVLKAFYDGADKFAEMLKKNDCLYERMFSFFTADNISNCNNIAIFGAGHFGKIIFDFLELCGANPILLDNGIKNTHIGFDESDIYRPDEIAECENYTVIIANTECFEEMKTQLLNLGYDEEKIIVCENEDLFLREVFMNGFLFKS